MEERPRVNEARDKVRGCAGAETLIPSYIDRLTGQRFFAVNDFDFDSAWRNEINRPSSLPSFLPSFPPRCSPVIVFIFVPGDSSQPTSRRSVRRGNGRNRRRVDYASKLNAE